MFAHRRHFAEVHQRSPWQQADVTLPEDGSQKATPSPDVVELEVLEEGLSQVSPDGDVRFPVKAFAQMCLAQPSSALRLESHVVETLVLGCDVATCHAGASVGAGSGTTTRGGDDRIALDAAKRDGLDAICEFHGTGGWTSVDRQGLVTGGAGVEKAESAAAPWQEVVWDWYDARF